ncbi:hypothetical protein NDU88_005786 [Pleurodeles waltl]|uniref:Uncharacterized protein n=1 Tax=Pleurodeles waltl TaxID=8319 RepID=A0AAV7PKJ5_PLEWA|nr:hypothetical protein NDU88_005786 [Pleurodeles waltl]
MFAGPRASPIAPPMFPILLASARSDVCSRADGTPPRKLITSFYQKVDNASFPQKTNGKTNIKRKEKEKEGSKVQRGDLENNDNVNDHGVDEDGEPDECLARDSEKRAAKSIAEGTELILVGSLGFMPVDEEAKVIEEQICGNLCSMPKSQLSVPASLRLRCRSRVSQGWEDCGGTFEPPLQSLYQQFVAIRQRIC